MFSEINIIKSIGHSANTHILKNVLVIKFVFFLPELLLGLLFRKPHLKESLGLNLRILYPVLLCLLHVSFAILGLAESHLLSGDDIESLLLEKLLV